MDIKKTQPAHLLLPWSVGKVQDASIAPETWKAEEIVVQDKEGGFALNTTTLATCPLDERYGDSWEGTIREIIQMFPLEREICCFTVSKSNINKAGDK